MISALFSRLIILFFGTLYPAYASYKAVRTKNVKEYVKWMMYWIVFAFFTCIETFTDIFLSWFPFYYEVKVVIVLWLLSPATKGSSTLYRKFVHPMLTRREQEIDEYLNQAKERGYSAVLQLGSKGVNYATNVIMQTAIKFAMAAAPTTRGIQMSQSDNDLYVSRDDTDHQWMPRSSSLTILDTYAETEYEYNGDVLGDDDNEIMEVEELLVGDAGAARLRDLPSRKTQSKRATATVAATRRGSKTRSTRGESSSGTAGGIRGRRKLREATPDVDVEGD
ncbi:receptor expression-enhancing protein 1 isoform X5 [Drosophila willistoni]|uniref:receptor expression-enhancing protein 1 isoform X5 n=1 Tax=Drosophila willistoni TaxID=7260 RepID=UPI001F07A1B8|nr:receptor expression-enhancing protein 1 isoform X5 [Drosophila willistoni]